MLLLLSLSCKHGPLRRLVGCQLCTATHLEHLLQLWLLNDDLCADGDGANKHGGGSEGSSSQSDGRVCKWRKNGLLGTLQRTAHPAAPKSSTKNTGYPSTERRLARRHSYVRWRARVLQPQSALLRQVVLLPTLGRSAVCHAMHPGQRTAAARGPCVMI